MSVVFYLQPEVPARKMDEENRETDREDMVRAMTYN